MPRIFLVDAKWEGEIKLSENLKRKLEKEKPKSVAIFSSIQFTPLDNLIKQIEQLNIKVNTTKAKRTDEKIQVLGCDCYSDAFKDQIIKDSDLIIYVGDGLFHPKALLLSQKNNKIMKPIILFDPISDSVKEITKKDISTQLKRYKRNLKLFMHAKGIGILVTIKPGQQYFALARRLKEKLKEQGKQAYIFIDNTFDYGNMENYPFIDAWVNTACPRIGTDDIVNIEKPLINLKEAFNPAKALEEIESE